jgi:hypothetical protein
MESELEKWVGLCTRVYYKLPCTSERNDSRTRRDSVWYTRFCQGGVETDTLNPWPITMPQL